MMFAARRLRQFSTRAAAPRQGAPPISMTDLTVALGPCIIAVALRGSLRGSTTFSAHSISSFECHASLISSCVLEYPTSFVSHLRTQKLNVFNIGIAFLTLSLSSQLVSYKQKYEQATKESEALTEKVQVLEQLVVGLGGTLPADDEIAVAAAAEAAKAEQEKQQRERAEEAQLLAAMTGSDGKASGKKGMLI